MATGTELMGSTSDEIQKQAEAERRSQEIQQQGKLEPGENVAGYSVISNLSFSGGEAELYICEKQGVRYALKYFKTPPMDNNKSEDINAKLKNLRHPNIMSFIDYGTYKNLPFSIYQLAEGGVLNEKTESSAQNKKTESGAQNKKIEGDKFLPLSEEKAIEAVEEILEGLHTIHKIGIIHRDIKPENIFYTSACQDEKGQWIGSGILLGDFGISSLYDVEGNMTSKYTQTDFATEGYEGPEMYAVNLGTREMRISPAIDYWALGITLWVLLTGERPFVDEKGNKLPDGQVRKNAANNDTAKILLSRSPKLSDKMKKLIRGLLVVRHKERWNYEKVKDHLAGKNVEVFQEPPRILPTFMVGNTK